MSEVSIVFEQKLAQANQITLYYRDQGGTQYYVIVYKQPPPDYIVPIINRYSASMHYLHLSGGTPDAYETISNNWNATVGHLHRFEFDDTYEDPPTWFHVLHYWNCNPNLRDSNVNQNSIIHFGGVPDWLIQPDDLPIEMVEIVKSSHIVAEIGSRSLKQLVECATQINRIGAELLPAMLKETQTTRMAVNRLQKRTNGKLPLSDAPESDPQ